MHMLTEHIGSLSEDEYVFSTVYNACVETRLEFTLNACRVAFEYIVKYIILKYNK